MNVTLHSNSYFYYYVHFLVLLVLVRACRLLVGLSSNGRTFEAMMFALGLLYYSLTTIQNTIVIASLGIIRPPPSAITRFYQSALLLSHQKFNLLEGNAEKMQELLVPNDFMKTACGMNYPQECT